MKIRKLSIARCWPRNVKPEVKLPVSFTKRNAEKYVKLSVLSLPIPSTN